MILGRLFGNKLELNPDPVNGHAPSPKKTCIDCDYITQGETCCYCGHPNASEEAKRYVTYFFWCYGWRAAAARNEDVSEEATS